MCGSSTTIFHTSLQLLLIVPSTARAACNHIRCNYRVPVGFCTAIVKETETPFATKHIVTRPRISILTQPAPNQILTRRLYQLLLSGTKALYANSVYDHTHTHTQTHTHTHTHTHSHTHTHTHTHTHPVSHAFQVENSVYCCDQLRASVAWQSHQASMQPSDLPKIGFMKPKRDDSWVLCCKRLL
jgi:hypothetical protein